MRGQSIHQAETNTTTSQPEEVREGGDARVSTSLITVPAVVMDRNGRYIGNLRKEDFRIYEDGVEQEVAYFASVEKPFTVALLLDVSGSTQFQLTQIREAANTFVGRLRMNDLLMAITFDGRMNVLTQPERVAVIRRGKLHIPAVDRRHSALRHCRFRAQANGSNSRPQSDRVDDRRRRSGQSRADASRLSKASPSRTFWFTQSSTTRCRNCRNA